MEQWIYASLTHQQKTVESIPARCRIMTNNINKNTSTKTPQREQKADFKTLKIPTDFLFPAFRTCERATLERRKGHSCVATVALLQARMGPFRPIFAPHYVSIKFKRLIISVLKMSPKSLIYAERIVGCKYRNIRGRKRRNSLTVIYPDISPVNIDSLLLHKE